MAAVQPLLPPLRRAGVTPNMVTGASFVAGAASVALCFSGRPVAGAALWVLGYACDVADGFMARRYGMETELCGRLDHATDLLAFCGLAAFVASRLPGRPLWPLGVEALLLAGAFYHLQCQEKGTRHLPIEGLGGAACRDKGHLRWTRWVGTGTLTAWHVFLILFYG